MPRRITAMSDCQAGIGAESEEEHENLCHQGNIIHPPDEGGGNHGSTSLREKRVATLFEPEAGVPAQTTPSVPVHPGLPFVCGSRQALATAAGSLRSALSEEASASSFSKPTRNLTEQTTTL